MDADEAKSGATWTVGVGRQSADLRKMISVQGERAGGDLPHIPHSKNHYGRICYTGSMAMPTLPKMRGDL